MAVPARSPAGSAPPAGSLLGQVATELDSCAIDPLLSSHSQVSSHTQPTHRQPHSDTTHRNPFHTGDDSHLCPCPSLRCIRAAYAAAAVIASAALLLLVVSTVAGPSVSAVWMAPTAPSDRRCLRGAYSSGEWVYEASRWYPYLMGAPDGYCDAVDEANHAWSTYWQVGPYPLNLSTPTAPLNSSIHHVRPSVHYRWQPHSCDLAPFPLYSPVDFCLALNNRSLVLLGDSITRQHYLSLIALLQRGAHRGVQATDEVRYGQPMYFRHDVCHHLLAQHLGTALNDTTAYPDIVAIRNDLLSPVVSVTERTGSRTDLEYPWQPHISPTAIVVLNTGMHYEPDDVYTQHLTSALTWLRTARPRASVIWRSTVPGHAGCDDVRVQVPLTEAQWGHLNAQRLVTHQSPEPSWGWSDTERQNAIGLRTLRQVYNLTDPLTGEEGREVEGEEGGEGGEGGGFLGFGKGYVLDAFALSRLRPDGHLGKDCLHTCLPGPPDEWNTILYNMLINRAS